MKALLQRTITGFLEKSFARKTVTGTLPFDLHQSPGYFRSFGNRNGDKSFYVIWCRNMGNGFFSNFAHVLCHLKRAEDMNMIPVVDFLNFKTLFNEKPPVSGTENAWEYYFKPVSPFPLSEVYKSKNVFFCSGSYPENMSYNISRINGLYNDIFRKYIRLQEHVEESLKQYETAFSGNVLGVHFRGGDMKIHASHPFPATERQMFNCTDQIIEKYHVEKIFVASDDAGYVDLYQKRYGQMILCTESFRVYKGNAYNVNPRELHRYLLGMDVLIDASLLSKCRGLLCTDSNVAEFARFVNNGKYEFVYQIYNGINSSNPLIARYLYRFKKLLPRRFGGLPGEVWIS